KYYINPDIKKTETLPASFYTDHSIFLESKEKIFASSGQFAGDSSWKESYTSFPLKLFDVFLDDPLLLTHHKGKLNCLSNVCTHRGNLRRLQN
ncbi:MAG: aromatic ring-hydroxylating dioxygenase subunit alpha, partial [Bacteroidetes bacterium]|nr:aromatic ring-hydroxylating dioxygenase subunit alpha [Bacteroidota bacterium]